jgi:hypothetical protein
MREANANEPLMKHRNTVRRHRNQNLSPILGSAWKETYLLAMRCPVYRRREPHSGICMELENLIGDDKGKMHKRKNREAEIPML